MIRLIIVQLVTFLLTFSELYAKDLPSGDYYIDPSAGDNSQEGKAPEKAWRDFTWINDVSLQEGTRIFIRRGTQINQELRLSAKGSESRPVEITGYGTGARPVIRRNWDISERCVWIKNPDHIKISGLTFAYAGKGLVVSYLALGHSGLIIEDCVAHHIEGIYREYVNLSGIPDWQTFRADGSDRLLASAGIAVVGNAKDVTIRDCDIFQCSWGFLVSGQNVLIHRVNVHDCFIQNTSPHPGLISAHDVKVIDCVFDAAGYSASAGTMAFFVGGCSDVEIRGCHFRNQPDSGSYDQGGIDFEAGGQDCLVTDCTFENNAGAAIEVLGLTKPQTRNIEIIGNRFIGNNWAKILGPSEIFIWGGSRDPKICCSTGVVAKNAYLLAGGVSFFKNQAPELTDWNVSKNEAFSDKTELERKYPYDKPPNVTAECNISTSDDVVELKGVVTDDCVNGKELNTRWELLEGPGEVRIEKEDAIATRAVFPKKGDYLLRLLADDGRYFWCGYVVVHALGKKNKCVAAWEFNQPAEKEGWKVENTGVPNSIGQVDTETEKAVKPVNYVGGGHYVFALKEAKDPKVVWSLPKGEKPIEHSERLVLNFQNRTGSEKYKIDFNTVQENGKSEKYSIVLPVTPNDSVVRRYEIPILSGIKGIQGIEISMSDGRSMTGLVRVDYIILETTMLSADE